MRPRKALKQDGEATQTTQYRVEDGTSPAKSEPKLRGFWKTVDFSCQAAVHDSEGDRRTILANVRYLEDARGDVLIDRIDRRSVDFH